MQAQLNLPLTALLDLMFGGNDALVQQREFHARLDVYKYGAGTIIPISVAQLIFAADPGELLTHIQAIDSPVGEIFVLWRRTDWLGSEARRFEITLARKAERARTDTRFAKEKRLADMARVLMKVMGWTESHFPSAQARFADIYYNECSENEEHFKSFIADLARVWFKGRATVPDLYVPLSIEVMQLIEKERAGTTETVPTLMLPATSGVDRALEGFDLIEADVNLHENHNEQEQNTYAQRNTNGVDETPDAADETVDG